MTFKEGSIPENIIVKHDNSIIDLLNVKAQLILRNI